MASRKADKDYSWEKKVLTFKNWLIKEGSAETSATTASSVVRGFFSFYRLPLKFRRSEAATLKKASRKYEDYRFSKDDLKRIYDVSDLQEKYIVTAGKSFGLRAGDFLKLTRGDLEPYLDREPPISIGEYATEKEGVPAYPFIDIDALPVIRLMIKTMDREGRTKPTDRILKFKDTIQLTRNLKRVAEKAGLKVGTKVVRFHCLRKFLTDRLSSFMSESKWKQVVGKTISEEAYVSPDTLRKDYQRAIPETCFTPQPNQTNILIAEIRTRMEALPAEQRKRFASEIATSYRSTAHVIFEDPKIKELLQEKPTRTDGANIDCGIQYEEIDEANLLQYLRAGWCVTHSLQNGKVIVSKGT